MSQPSEHYPEPTAEFPSRCACGAIPRGVDEWALHLHWNGGDPIQAEGEA